MSFRKPQAFPPSNVDYAREASSTGENGGYLVVGPRETSSLPILDHANRIVFALEKHSVLIVVGGTGCGKSTQIPQILDRAGWTQKGQCIACTQPRRLAAITLSKRVSEEMNVSLGEKVGYSVRFDEQCDKRGIRTSIKYATELMLIRETLVDPLLSRYSVVMIDDAHERSLQSDVLLGLLKKILQQRRIDFKVIISSATVEAAVLRDYFELVTGAALDSKHRRVCVLHATGIVHPVDTVYLRQPSANYLTEAVDTVLSIAAREPQGDILCFLPGAEEVEEAVGVLEDRLGVNEYQTLVVIPLHSAMAPSAQLRVFEKLSSANQETHGSSNSNSNSNRIGGGGEAAAVRKVIVTTSIAESSITIPGVRYVVDCGYTQSKYFDVRSGVEMLITRVVSRAEATQRAGRAGRTMSGGRCFRLMREEYYLASPHISDYPTPEMQRVDVTWVVLQLKALGIDDVLHFDFPSPPSPASLIHALDLLFSLSALDKACTLTTTGRCMADLPLNPQLSRCLLSSLEPSKKQEPTTKGGGGGGGCGVEMLAITAMCSVEYPFYSPHHTKALTHCYYTHRDLQIQAQTYMQVQTGGEPTKADLRRFLSSRISSLSDHTSDHLTLLAVYKAFEENGCSQQWCNLHCVQHRVMKQAAEIRTNLYRLLRDYESRGSGGGGGGGGGAISSCGEDSGTVLKCLLTGMFSNVAKFGTDGRYHTIRAGLPVRLHPSSALLLKGADKNKYSRSGGGGGGGGPPEWIMYNEVLSTTLASSLAASEREGAWAGVKDVVVVREASAINPQWLLEVSSHYYKLLE